MGYATENGASVFFDCLYLRDELMTAIPGGFKTWPQEFIDAYRKWHPLGSKASLAFGTVECWRPPQRYSQTWPAASS